MKSIRILSSVIALGLVASPAFAGKAAKEYVMVNEEVGVPVFPYDITDKPYKIISGVTAGVRKATIFSKEPSQDKIYKELWERGEKLGADAVVLAGYGDSHVTALSWGKTNAHGVAIKFLTDAEIASGMTGDKAADFNPEKDKVASK